MSKEIIYEHIYDNPKDEKGEPKPNKKLGEFEIIYGSVNDDYEFNAIGINISDGKVYEIDGREILNMSGNNPNGGTWCSVKEMDFKGYKIVKDIEQEVKK